MRVMTFKNAPIRIVVRITGKTTREENKMKFFRVTHYNPKNGQTRKMVVANSLELAIRKEEKLTALFSKITPGLTLVSAEAI